MWSTSLRCLYSEDALNVKKGCGIVYIQWTKFLQFYLFIIVFMFSCDISLATINGPLQYNSSNEGFEMSPKKDVTILPFYNINNHLKLNLTFHLLSDESKDICNISIKLLGPNNINKCRGNLMSSSQQSNCTRTMILPEDVHNTLLLSKCTYEMKIIPKSAKENQIIINYTIPDTSIAKNINVYPFYNQVEGEIYLNVTWQNPTVPILPVEYNVKIIPLNLSEPNCEAYSQHQERYIPAKETSLTFPKNIIPSCSYKIEVIEQPSNDAKPPAINFTVPECVSNHCACHYINPKPPGPVLSVSRISSNKIKVTWSIPTEHRMKNINTIFFSAVLAHSTGNKNTYYSRNISNTELDSSMEDIFNIPNMTTGALYTLQAFYTNISNCKSNHALLSFYAVPIWEIHQILLPIICVCLVIILIYVIKKRKCCVWSSNHWLCYRLRGQHRAPYPKIRKIYRPTTEGARSCPYLSVPMEYNNLYIEKEIAEEQERGRVDKYEISYTRLQFEEEIGNGAFGRVYRARITNAPSSSTYSIVAVKKLGKNTSAEEMEEFLLEIAMHKHVGRHPNIVTFLGCCTLRRPYCMIMEYVPCGDLLRYLQALRVQYEKKNKTFLFTVNKSFNISRSSSNEKQRVSDSSYITPESIPSTRLPSVTETEYTTLGSDIIVPTTPEIQPNSPTLLECVLDPKELQNFALQIARGMEYLEQKQIVHRDLAARNVLIHENKTLKISDFGLSRSGIYVNSKQKKVPLRWLSIEAIRYNLYTCKSDVWAYGVVLWEIGTLGAFPYSTQANNEIIGYLLKGKRLEKPENCTDELYDIMLQCWSHVADSRPSFADLVEYLQTISSKRHVYVDFSHLNPTYVFPPTEEQINTIGKTEENIKTVEIILPDKNS